MLSLFLHTQRVTLTVSISQCLDVRCFDKFWMEDISEPQGSRLWRMGEICMIAGTSGPMRGEYSAHPDQWEESNHSVMSQGICVCYSYFIIRPCVKWLRDVFLVTCNVSILTPVQSGERENHLHHRKLNISVHESWGNLLNKYFALKWCDSSPLL